MFSRGGRSSPSRLGRSIISSPQASANASRTPSKRGLADKFRDHRFARLIGDVILRILGRRRNLFRKELLTQTINAFISEGRNRNNRAPLPQLFNSQKVFKHVRAARYRTSSQPQSRASGQNAALEQWAISRPDALIRGHTRDDAINFGQGLANVSLRPYPAKCADGGIGVSTPAGSFRRGRSRGYCGVPFRGDPR